MTRKVKLVIAIAVGLITPCGVAAFLFVSLSASNGFVVVSGDYGLVQSPLGGEILVKYGIDTEIVVVPENVTIIEKGAEFISGISENKDTSSNRRVILQDADKNTFFGELPPRAYFVVDVLKHRIQWFRDPEHKKPIRDLPESDTGISIAIRQEIR